MGDWDLAYEMGLEDGEGGYGDNCLDDTDYISNASKCTIEVKLTPIKYLNNAQHYMRNKLFNNHLNKPKLEILHDKFNLNDKLAIAVYCNEVMIGFIQKLDNLNNINSFCFHNNQLINDVKINYENNSMYLSRRLVNKQHLSDENIIKYVTAGFRNSHYYLKYKTLYCDTNELIKIIRNSMEDKEFELRTQADYKNYIIKNIDLYENNIIQWTIKKENEIRILDEQHKKKESEKIYLELDFLSKMEKLLTEAIQKKLVYKLAHLIINNNYIGNLLPLDFEDPFNKNNINNQSGYTKYKELLYIKKSILEYNHFNDKTFETLYYPWNDFCSIAFLKKFEFNNVKENEKLEIKNSIENAELNSRFNDFSEKATKKQLLLSQEFYKALNNEAFEKNMSVDDFLNYTKSQLKIKEEHERQENKKRVEENRRKEELKKDLIGMLRFIIFISLFVIILSMI